MKPYNLNKHYNTGVIHRYSLCVVSSQLAFIKTQQAYTQNKSRYPLLYHSTKQQSQKLSFTNPRYTNANKELKQQQSRKQHCTKPLYIATSTPTITSELSSKSVAE